MLDVKTEFDWKQEKKTEMTFSSMLANFGQQAKGYEVIIFPKMPTKIFKDFCPEFLNLTDL